MIGMTITITAPDFRTMSPESFFFSSIKSMEKELDIANNLFDRQTKTWTSKSKPEWERTPAKFEDGTLSASIGTSSVPFVWVNLPRKPGRATFSHDYRPKTRPRKLGSGRGAGQIYYRGRDAKPIKKVTPRMAHERVAEVRQEKYAKRTSKAVIRDFNHYFRTTGQRVRVVRVL
jgi:hypothetical protein